MNIARLRRLSAAALQLSKRASAYHDVAFDFVFDSHEGFHASIHQAVVGLAPSRIRNVTWSGSLFQPGLRQNSIETCRKEIFMMGK